MYIYDGRTAFYQWDTNQRIVCESFEVGDEVHFFNLKQPNALVVLVYELNGEIVADVPNILLQSSYPIIVYRMYIDNSGQYTRQEHTFKVNQRAKPANYVYTETEIKNYADIDARVVKLEGEGLSKAVADYLKENPIEAGATAEEAAQIAQNKQDIENLSDLKLDASKLPEAVNDALAQAKASGDFDGKDGYTPQKGIDYFDGEPGKTPIKGEDYFTDADKQEIAELAADMVDVPEGNTAELFFAVYGETTYAEVTEALDDGKMVYVKYDTSLVPYVGTSGNHHFQFINNYGFAVKITLYSDNKWNSHSEQYLTSSSLSNYYNKNQVDDLLDGLDTGGSNQPLTFTGAVNATYDGSEAVSVEIPAGGGGGSSAEWKKIEDVTLNSDVASWSKVFDKAYKKFKILVYAFSGANIVAGASWLEISIGEGKRFLGKPRHQTNFAAETDVEIMAGYLITTCKTTCIYNGAGAVSDIGWKLATTTNKTETNTISLYGDAYLKTGARIIIFAEDEA